MKNVIPPCSVYHHQQWLPLTIILIQYICILCLLTHQHHYLDRGNIDKIDNIQEFVVICHFLKSRYPFRPQWKATFTVQKGWSLKTAKTTLFCLNALIYWYCLNQLDPPYNGHSCIESCQGKLDGNYQSCYTCTEYIQCKNGTAAEVSCPKERRVSILHPGDNGTAAADLIS